MGFHLPVGPLATRKNTIRVAKEAEALQYDSLWVLDRLLFPVKPRTPYQATPDGSLPPVYSRTFDPVDNLLAVAAVTEKIKLGTSVVDAPFYNPIVFARRFMTLDVFSEGRTILGLGLGWSVDEYETAGIPMKDRGLREDEFIAVLKEIWTKEISEFNGKFYKIPPSRFELKPIQKPHPPIILGGFAPGTLDRVARSADGWNPIAVDSPQGIGKMIDGLKEQVRNAGRDASNLQIVIGTFPTITAEKQGDKRWPLTGDAEQIRQDIQGFKEVGVTHLFFNVNFGPAAENIDSTLNDMKQLRDLAS
ncbi:MAG: TIGR03619 family F420-dependent LLM class oxidoreductase [Nitrososphaerales archaeon]